MLYLLKKKHRPPGSKTNKWRYLAPATRRAKTEVWIDRSDLLARGIRPMSFNRPEAFRKRALMLMDMKPQLRQFTSIELEPMTFKD